jgi:hypothetical protein
LSHVRKFVLLVVGACACSIVFSGEPTMTAPLLSEPRPWCIGRFVFDRPVASEISNQRYEFRGEKIVTQYNVSLGGYLAKTEAREKELQAKRRIDPGNRNKETSRSWMEKAFSPVRDSRVFVYQDAATDGITLPFDTEGYIYEKRTLFHTTGGIGSSAIGKAEDIYNDTYRRIKARDNWSIPTESGFCFDGGIVTGSSTYTEEVSQSFALMPGRPALLLMQMRDAVDTDRQPLTRTLPRTLPQLRAQGSHARPPD